MTIYKKSLITLSAAALVFFTIVIISMLVFMNFLYYEINITNLRNTAKTLMAAIGEERIADLFTKDDHSVDTALPLNPGDTYRLTLITPSGNVLWDSHVTDDLVNHIDREEVIAAAHGKEGSSQRDSVSTGMRRIYYALPVFQNNDVVGVFRLSYIIRDFGARISPVVIPFVIFICLFIVTAFLVIIIYSRSLSVSLGRLVSIAQTNTKIFSDPQAFEQVAPEFRSLEKAMRAMSAELNMRFEQAKSEGSRLEAILNGMWEAVLAVDSDLKLQLVNQKARELFNLGSSPSVLLDVNKMNLLTATRSTELVDAARKAINTVSPLEIELVFRTGLTERFFQLHASPFSGNNNSGVVLVLLEITKLKKLERIRKDFVANVSHELRTPIQLIKGFSETLLDANLDKQNHHFIEIISKNAGAMENLTNDLLILADLEDNCFKNKHIEDLFIAPLLTEAVSTLELQVQNKKIKIEMNCPDGLKAVLSGSLLIQAMINLIDNGIKYSPSDSTIRISAFEMNDEIVFEVKDEGQGIASEHLERIFERFYRVDKSRSRDAGGTGLGLAIVHHIALFHRGKVEVESELKKGSVFRIRIPLNLGA